MEDQELLSKDGPSVRTKGRRRSQSREPGSVTTIKELPEPPYMPSGKGEEDIPGNVSYEVSDTGVGKEKLKAGLVSGDDNLSELLPSDTHNQRTDADVRSKHSKGERRKSPLSRWRNIMSQYVKFRGEGDNDRAPTSGGDKSEKDQQISKYSQDKRWKSPLRGWRSIMSQFRKLKSEGDTGDTSTSGEEEIEREQVSPKRFQGERQKGPLSGWRKKRKLRGQGDDDEVTTLLKTDDRASVPRGDESKSDSSQTSPDKEKQKIAQCKISSKKLIRFRRRRRIHSEGDISQRIWEGREDNDFHYYET